MAEVPETRFAKLGGDRIAYQVVGEGPLDLLYTGQGGDAMDARWEWPPYIKFLNRLASFSRLIMFDPRGVGASDSISFEGLPPWEQWADDVRTVLDAVDSERATLLGGGDTGAAAILFAATEPERTSALMLFSASARFVVADDYPWGLPEELSDDVMGHMVESWGTEAITDILAPTMAGDLAFRRWFAKASRGSHSPRGAARYFQVVQGLDVRHVLPLVRVPTLVLHPEDSSLLPVEMGRYLAEHIPQSKFVVLPGEETALYAERTASTTVDEIEEFLTGTRHAPSTDRVLATVLFTDIVGSTQRAAELGDHKWRELLDAHDRTVRRQLEQFRGREVDTAGDGFFVTFDGPGRAIECACAIRDAVRALSIEVRAGLHTGEIEMRGDKVAGLAVHIGARVAARATANEVLVSGTVKDLVVGSGIEFTGRGERELKGVPGSWKLFAVTG